MWSENEIDMANEKGRNKKKREKKKIERLQRLLGIDLCACGGGHQLRCEGPCRECHRNPGAGNIKCEEMYQIDSSSVKQGGPRRPKRDWKFGRQKEGNENRLIKQQRREKIERNRSNQSI